METVNRVTKVLRGMDIRLAALIVQFLMALAFNLMQSFLPLFISVELNYPLIEATYWTGLAQFISSSLMAFTAPFWGFMCDRAGIKKITMIMLAANAIVYAGMSTSTTIFEVVLFRGLQGGFGGISTAMFTLAALIAPVGELKQTLGYQMSMMTVGNLVGPGVGGLLASLIGYRLTLIASSLLFVIIIPLMFSINVPHPAKQKSKEPRFTISDFKAIIPDIASLMLIYACINFITPVIPWSLRSLGISDQQLLTYTALTTVLNGVTFVAATPLVTRIVTDRTLPLLSVAAAGAILMTAFVSDPYQFIALRVAVGAIQAGIPPSLLGGERATRKGMAMGILNSARFLGSALGPFIATSILLDGERSRAPSMFATMACLSFLASIIIYLTHRGSRESKVA